jgi:hypothetical protein
MKEKIKGKERRRDTIGAERRDNEHEIKQSKVFMIERRGQEIGQRENLSRFFTGVPITEGLLIYSGR